MSSPHPPVNVSEFEALARERMTASAYDYYAGGAEDELTLRANREAFQRIALRPRVLAGTGAISTRVDLLGLSLALPVALAPTAFNRLGHPGRRDRGRARGRRGGHPDVLQHGGLHGD